MASEQEPRSCRGLQRSNQRYYGTSGGVDVKKLNAEAITNELTGASQFFQRRPAEAQPIMPVATEVVQVKPQAVPVPVPPYGVPRTPVPPRRAIRQRQPFDVFEDQYREL